MCPTLPLGWTGQQLSLRMLRQVCMLFPPKKFQLLFLYHSCLQTVRLVGMGTIYIRDKDFSNGNKASLKVQSPMFHLDKPVLVGTKPCYKARPWPGKKRPSGLCFPLCHGWGPCHQLCSPSRALWVLRCADCCWRPISWMCSCESLCNNKANGSH